MKLEDIGFYTLSDERARNTSPTSPMQRCELIITDRCNFKCPYCRGIRPECRGDISLLQGMDIISMWAEDGLKNIRFSGGEPTIHKHLVDFISYAKEKGIERIAISTNGSAKKELYKKLIDAGCNDFSISLDACCSEDVSKMSGGKAKYKHILEIIEFIAISNNTYTTVGIVINEDNQDQALETISVASFSGVWDIRIISSAQNNKLMGWAKGIKNYFLGTYPILQYRVGNIQKNRNVRGIESTDSHVCSLVQDDSMVSGDYHFPCIIHFREGGKAIGKIGPNMRKERIEWMKQHDSHKDSICKKNCLDVCIDYNNCVRRMQW